LASPAIASKSQHAPRAGRARRLRRRYCAMGSVPELSPKPRTRRPSVPLRASRARQRPRFAGTSLRGADGTRTADLLRSMQTTRDTRNVPICRTFEAADGTRTHDLLHGKQTLIAPSHRLYPCKSRPSAPRGRFVRSPDFVAFRRGCVPQWSPDIVSHVSSAAPRAPRSRHSMRASARDASSSGASR